MRFALTDLIRLIAATGMAMFTLAVALGQWKENAAGPAEAAPTYSPAIPYTFIGTRSIHHARFLDTRTGDEVAVDLPPGERIEHASCAPWQDPRGRRIIAGRWSRLSHEGENSTGLEFGLAYFRAPDGACLQRVASEVWPVSTPCWYPDGPDRILFAAGDGRLYQHRLDASDAQASPDQIPLTPLAIDESLGWEEPPFLCEPHWPDIPGDRRVLFVSLARREPGASRLESPAIWWLRLDQGGDRVIDAGRLTTPSPNPEGDAPEEYRPSCFYGPDGTPRLLFEARRGGESKWELMVAEVSTDPRTLRPFAGPSRSIGEHALSGVHSLSPDGRWVYSILRAWGADPKVRKDPFSVVPTTLAR